MAEIAGINLKMSNDMKGKTANATGSGTGIRRRTDIFLAQQGIVVADSEIIKEGMV